MSAEKSYQDSCSLPVWSEATSSNGNSQSIVMRADKPPQIRPNLAWRFKPRSLGSFFLLLHRNVGALRVMFQITKHADGEQVPGCSLIANKDEILWLTQRLRI